MKKIHMVDNHPYSRTPFCANRVDMARRGFETTEDIDEVTCKLCLMRLGIIEDTRGNKSIKQTPNTIVRTKTERP